LDGKVACMRGPAYPELPPDVSCVQGSARPSGEDKIVIASLAARGEPLLGLPHLVGSQRIYRHLGEAERPARFLGLGVFMGPATK
jgi:hypothetical protein